MHTSLKPFNTFGIDVCSKALIIAKTPEQLNSAWQEAACINEPVIILGEGSNVLFLADFNGTVILNRIEGINVTSTADFWHLHVGAGENWHALVQETINRGIYGLENLALIPGCVGSSPIQNIGAYGVELRDVCEYVEGIDLNSGQFLRLNAEECKFEYRDSVFKHDYLGRFAITAVGFRLPHKWSPVITYGDLAKLNPGSVTPQQIFDCVCQMRSSKLPDPKLQGNAGSFFKNPVISTVQAEALLNQYPDMPHYPQTDGTIKLAAGWLIDRCSLKGYRCGGAAVHYKQALVLINEAHATSEDVVKLAHTVRHRVGEKFDVWLEPEVRFIGCGGEMNAVEVIR